MIYCLIGIPIIIFVYAAAFYYFYLFFKNRTFKLRDPISTYLQNKFILKYFKNRVAIWCLNFLISLSVAVSYFILWLTSFGMTTECFK
jgi:hypothetical protein